MNATWDRLVAAATDVLTASEWRPETVVVAAALRSDGTTVVAANVEHSSGGTCAEIALLGQVQSTPDDTPITHLVAVMRGGTGVVPPCGRCRQVLVDYFPDLLVLVPDGDSLRAVPVPDLLPYRFDWESLRPAD